MPVGIDKTSSAELSEAINSMFLWYERSEVCYVFLSDFEGSPRNGDNEVDLSHCRWFTRGWTLQELLVPYNVWFFDAHLQRIGTKHSLARSISSVTRIGVEYLQQPAKTYIGHPSNSNFRKASIAQKMSWASRRQTSRLEDMAYCLLGMFDVSMPLLYGEGRKAFLRLQQQIVTQSTDESIFAWTIPIGQPAYLYSGVFAQWPSDFERSGNIYRSSTGHSQRPPTLVTSRGLQLHVLIPPWRSWVIQRSRALGRTLTVWLDCEYRAPGTDVRRSVAIELKTALSSTDASVGWFRTEIKVPIHEVEGRQKWRHLTEMIFGTYAPIYVHQTSLQEDPAELHRIAPFEEESVESTFRDLRRSSRFVPSLTNLDFSAVQIVHRGRTLGKMLLVLTFFCMNLFVVMNPDRVSQRVSVEAAWTWYYLMLGFTIFQNSYWFLGVVFLILQLDPSIGVIPYGFRILETQFWPAVYFQIITL